MLQELKYYLYAFLECYYLLQKKVLWSFWDINPCSPLKCQPMFRRKISTPYSGSKNKPTKKYGYVFLRNLWLSTDYTALYPRRYNSSQPPLWEPEILRSTWILSPSSAFNIVPLNTSHVSLIYIYFLYSFAINWIKHIFFTLFNKIQLVWSDICRCNLII
jgi:hypothetical protein